MISVERVYRCIGVTDGIDHRNRDVLAMTLLLRRLDPTTTASAEEWDELAEAGARIVKTLAHDVDDAVTAPSLLSLAVHEARTWQRARSVARAAPQARPHARARVRVRTAIRDA